MLPALAIAVVVVVVVVAAAAAAAAATAASTALPPRRVHVQRAAGLLHGSAQPALHHGNDHAGVGVVDGVKHNADDCSDGHSQDGASHAPQGVPQRQRQQHSDRVQLQGVPKSHWLHKVPNHQVHQRGPHKGSHAGGHCQPRVQDDQGHGHNGGNHWASLGGEWGGGGGGGCGQGA